MDKVDIKKMQSTQVITWNKARGLLIPEAHTFWIILKTLVAKRLGNYLSDIYFAKQKKKRLGFGKTIKFYLWAILNFVLRIDVEPYLKSSIIHKGNKNEK